MGHVFRDKSPYSFPGGVSKIVLHNAARVAEVWMDEWRDFYYAMNPGLLWPHLTVLGWVQLIAFNLQNNNNKKTAAFGESLFYFISKQFSPKAQKRIHITIFYD